MLTLTALLVSLACGPTPASETHHIVRRHDVADTAYVAYGRRFSAVGHIGRLGDATLIAPQWVLTAAHVAAAAVRRSPQPAVTVNGRSYAVDRVHVHPSWTEMGPHDIALVRLATPVAGVTPIPVARARPAPSRVATLVGHGATGTGDSRVRLEDGLRRAATSRIDSVTASAVFISFTPGAEGSPLEGAPGAGDSGGPLLLSEGGAWRVVGVSSAGYDGELGPGSYGAVDVFTRVDSHAGWIDSVLAGRAPATSTRPSPPPALPEPVAGPTSPSSSAASGQGASVPDTPIGRRAAAFVRAMQDGSDASILAFLRANFSEAELATRPAEQRLPNFRRLAGELRSTRVLRVLASSETSVTLELARTGTPPMVVELVAERGEESRLVDWRRFD